MSHLKYITVDAGKPVMVQRLAAIVWPNECSHLCIYGSKI
jgi:hypothetical protein